MPTKEMHKVARPNEVCSHTLSPHQDCQRRGWYAVSGERGLFCKQHAEQRVVASLFHRGSSRGRRASTPAAWRTATPRRPVFVVIDAKRGTILRDATMSEIDKYHRGQLDPRYTQAPPGRAWGHPVRLSPNRTVTVFTGY
jgi:hypothetical protein